MRISDWSSDVCSSDLQRAYVAVAGAAVAQADGQFVDRGGLFQFQQRGPGLHAREVQAVLPRVQEQPGRGDHHRQPGRASCRERVCQYVSILVVSVTLTNNTTIQQQLTEISYIP